MIQLIQKHGFEDAEIVKLEGLTFKFPEPLEVSTDGFREKHRYYYFAHDESLCNYDVWGPSEAFAKPQVSGLL